MPWSILHRYVLLELLRVFLMSLVAITGILVMAGIIAEASQQGFGPDQIIKILPLLIPGILPYTVPATILFAVSVVYGRLAHDNEITAIRAAGIPITKVLWPALLLGTGLSGIMLNISGHFIPYTHHLMRAMFINDVEELIYTLLRRDLCFNQPGVDYAIWVKEVQGRRLLRPTFKKRNAQGKEEIIAQAREAEIKVDLEKRVVHVFMLHGEMSEDGGERYVVFDREMVPVPLPPIGAAAKLRPRELTNDQIRDRQQQLWEERWAVEQEIATGVPKPPAKEAVDRIANYNLLEPPKKLAALDQEISHLSTEYYTRPAISLSCLFFVLIGCPVGIWFHKGDYLSAFVTCFLPIVVVYYPLMMFGINLGKEGHLDPAYSMWVGNGVLGFAGLILLWRLTRR